MCGLVLCGTARDVYECAQVCGDILKLTLGNKTASNSRLLLQLKTSRLKQSYSCRAKYLPSQVLHTDLERLQQVTQYRIDMVSLTQNKPAMTNKTTT